MHKILVVEDTKVFARMLRRKIECETGFSVVIAGSLAEAMQSVENDGPFDAAVLDLTLPDSFEGEVVDFIAPRIPSIVLTGDLSNETREDIWERKIVDYVLKEGQHNIDYTVRLIKRICSNKKVKTLVVDDSRTSRTKVNDLLSIHNYPVLEAADGVQALEVMDKHPDIKLVICDYNMPNMDGFALCRELRKHRSHEDLCIIGMSSEGNNVMSARFIKSGADDFITKPFLSEEFYCRITHGVDTLEYIDTVKRAAFTDFLTGLGNRQHFYDKAPSIFSNVCHTGAFALCMIDLDHFKKINDTHGHDGGDMVLRHTANLLRDVIPPNAILARFGGEEFCMLLPCDQGSEALMTCERIRLEMEQRPTGFEGKKIHCTVSIGMCLGTQQQYSATELDAAIRTSDQMLYKAKRSGRNKVIANL